jgi:hypothetical protein
VKQTKYQANQDWFWDCCPLVVACHWIVDCLRWRGRVLTGKKSHWCWDWDGLPVDETSDEFDCCGCWD